jgi:hypothetical protein
VEEKWNREEERWETDGIEMRMEYKRRRKRRRKRQRMG